MYISVRLDINWADLSKGGGQQWEEFSRGRIQFLYLRVNVVRLGKLEKMYEIRFACDIFKK